MASFDVKKAVAALQKNASGKSQRACATYVKKALAAGGLPYISGVDGFGVVDTYLKYGFKRVNVKVNGSKIVGAVAGDICSIACRNRSSKFPSYNKDGEVYPGHATMFDGTQWISDYRQGAAAIPYSQSNVKWVKVARWKDIPGDFTIPPEDNANGGAGGGDSGGSGDSGGNGGGSGPTQIIVVPNQYPTHSEYLSYSGSGGNIFEKAEKNKATFKSAVLATDNDKEYFTNKESDTHTRIYSTNDSCIVLDNLVLPLDDTTESWANKGITEEDVKKHQDMLKKEEEEAKKKAEEEKKKAEEEAKKQLDSSTNSSTGKNSSTNKNNSSTK